MAASMKFTYCLLMLSSVCLLTAQPLKDENTTTGITKVLNTLKEFVVTSSDKATTTTTKSQGNIGEIRKMALYKVMRLEKANIKEQVEGKTFHSKNLKSDQQITGVGRFSAVRFDEAEGFVAFSADYSAPKHHPPKNN